MDNTLEYSEKAQQDLLSIWDFIAYGNPVSGDPESADRVNDAIIETCDGLTDFPYLTQTPVEGVYRTIVKGFKNYLILYEFKDSHVVILRIFEASLGWDRVLKEEAKAIKERHV